MRILIAGCGDVGGALALRLREQNQVWGMRRNGARLPSGVEAISADLTQLGEIHLPEIDALVFCAAAKEASEAAYRAVYVDGLRALLKRLAPQKDRIKRILFTSSTSVYGQEDGTWVDESSAVLPRSYSGKVMLEAEQLVAGFGVSSCSVRFAGIYGPGRDRLLEAARRSAPSAAQQTSYGNRIHRDDCAGVLAHLLTLPQVDACTLAVDHEPAPMATVIDWLRHEMTKQGIALGTGNGQAAWPQRGGNKRCSNKRLLASGYSFQYPDFRAGYGQLMHAWCAEHASHNDKK